MNNDEIISTRFTRIEKPKNDDLNLKEFFNRLKWIAIEREEIENKANISSQEKRFNHHYFSSSKIKEEWSF